MKINNKGFTLVELLAALVILIAIMGIAIPSISSSLERNKESIDESKKQLIISASKLYIADNRNIIDDSVVSCVISINSLVDDGYLRREDFMDSNNKFLGGYILYKKNSGEYIYQDDDLVDEAGNVSEIRSCVS